MNTYARIEYKNCTITKYKDWYYVQHKISNENLIVHDYLSAMKAAKLLELEYRIYSWEIDGG